MNAASKSDLLGRCHELTEGEHPPELRAIARVLSAGNVDDAVLSELARSDASKPYGRRVIIDSPLMEGMVARWTRGVACAPHDHGGSYGGVRLLRGSALHTVYRVANGELEAVKTERVTAPHVLVCGPDLVHSMVDAGDPEALVTLHLYVDPIDFMHVFDEEAGSTYVVDGGCGAWVPHDQPELVREVLPGIQRMAG